MAGVLCCALRKSEKGTAGPHGRILNLEDITRGSLEESVAEAMGYDVANKHGLSRFILRMNDRISSAGTPPFCGAVSGRFFAGFFEWLSEHWQYATEKHCLTQRPATVFRCARKTSYEKLESCFEPEASILRGNRMKLDWDPFLPITIFRSKQATLKELSITPCQDTS